LVPDAGQSGRGCAASGIVFRAASRYRERHGVSRKKSDRQDAIMLANILRTDMAMHRALPGDTEQAEAVTVLARAHQDAVWRLHRAGNELRSLLREYFPAFLAIFAKQEGGVTCREARAILAIAPTPAAAARLTCPRIRAALKRCGRIYHLDTWTEKIHAASVSASSTNVPFPIRAPEPLRPGATVGAQPGLPSPHPRANGHSGLD
jgi:hypothetical protein